MFPSDHWERIYMPLVRSFGNILERTVYRGFVPTGLAVW